MRNKNLLILLFLLALGAGAWWAISKRSQTDTLNPEDTNFAIEDTAQVNRIFISDKRTGRSYDLTRKGKRDWVSKSGTKIFWPHMDQMLGTLHDLRVKRPVYDNERDNAVKQIAVNHYFIEVYQKDGSVKKFFMGPEVDQHKGNYAILEGKEVPYVIYVPSFEGYPGAHFAVNEAEWRDLVLFKSNSRSLQRVEVQFRDKPQENTIITFQNRRFHVEGVPNPDTTRLVEFLSVLADGYVENYYPDNTLRDSLLSTQPEYKIKVDDIDPEHSPEVWLYPPANWDPNKQISITGLLVKEKMPISIQKQSFEPLLAGKSHFVKGSGK